MWTAVGSIQYPLAYVNAVMNLLKLRHLLRLSTHEAINAAFDRAVANASCVPGLRGCERLSLVAVKTDACLNPVLLFS